jgi:hypothetical protein
MRLQESQNRINELMSKFVTQVKGARAFGLQDINRVSENVLIPLFAEVYGFKNLENLNYTEGPNYPGIDLGDKVAKVAIQVTATADVEKIKATLRKFVEYKHYKRYKRLIIYILTERQQSYMGKGFEEIIQGNFDFNKEEDVWDYRNVLAEVAHFQIDKTSKIEGILERNFGETRAPVFGEVYEPETEIVYLNLVEVFFPDTIYVADLDIDRQQVILNSKNFNKRVYRNSSTRDVANAALEQRGYRFAVDWECHEKKVVTFHNLANDLLPLTKIIDQGTVTPLGSEEFADISKDYENVFKSLLARCLQQKLYRQGVAWQNQDHLFIFVDTHGEHTRREKWEGKIENERTVYERIMKKTKPDEVLIHKHFAFRRQFKRFGNSWYLLIKPDWFFSYDGYRRSRYGAERKKWLKRQEKNATVFTHLRFIVYFLKNEKQSDLFEKRFPYPFLSFRNILSFSTAPLLNDKDWLPPKSSDNDKDEEDPYQMTLEWD